MYPIYNKSLLIQVIAMRQTNNNLLPVLPMFHGTSTQSLILFSKILSMIYKHWFDNGLIWTDTIAIIQTNVDPVQFHIRFNRQQWVNAILPHTPFYIIPNCMPPFGRGNHESWSVWTFDVSHFLFAERLLVVTLQSGNNLIHTANTWEEFTQHKNGNCTNRQ